MQKKGFWLPKYGSSGAKIVLYDVRAKFLISTLFQGTKFGATKKNGISRRRICFYPSPLAIP